MAKKLRPIAKLPVAKYSAARILKANAATLKPVPDEAAIPLRAGLRRRAAAKRSF